MWTGTHLIVSGVRQGTQAYALVERGGKWQATQAWKNTDVTMYMSAPVVADGTLYGISNKRKGQFVALDVANGRGALGHRRSRGRARVDSGGTVTRASF